MSVYIKNIALYMSNKNSNKNIQYQKYDLIFIENEIPILSKINIHVCQNDYATKWVRYEKYDLLTVEKEITI